MECCCAVVHDLIEFIKKRAAYGKFCFNIWICKYFIRVWQTMLPTETRVWKLLRAIERTVVVPLVTRILFRSPAWTKDYLLANHNRTGFEAWTDRPIEGPSYTHSEIISAIGPMKPSKLRKLLIQNRNPSVHTNLTHQWIPSSWIIIYKH